MNYAVERAALPVNSALLYLGIGRTSLYRLIAEGKIDARKFGKKTLILRKSADRFLASLTKEAA